MCCEACDLMPPLTRLTERLAANPEWRLIHDSVLDRALHIGRRVHLIHVLGRCEPGRLSFATTLMQTPPRIPLSRELLDGEAICGPGALFVEEQLQQVENGPEFDNGLIYCYVGRSCDDYGEVALAFHWTDSEATDTELWALPFDSGAFLKCSNDCHLAVEIPALPREDTAGRRAFIQQSLVRFPWRSEFSEWLAMYFSNDLAGYWTGRPTRADPDGLYDAQLNSGFRVESTWEVVLKRSVLFRECDRYCGSPQAREDLFRMIEDAVQDVERMEDLLAFRDKDLELLEPIDLTRGSPAAHLEYWVRQHALESPPA